MSLPESKDPLTPQHYAQLMGWDEELTKLQIKTVEELGIPVLDAFKEFYESWKASANSMESSSRESQTVHN
jgi:hypothetical protein